MKGVFDVSDPGVAVTQSSFGGGWAWPLNAAGVQALHEFFGEPPVPLAPIGGIVGYIVEPYQSGNLAEHLRSCNVAWEVQ